MQFSSTLPDRQLSLATTSATATVQSTQSAAAAAAAATTTTEPLPESNDGGGRGTQRRWPPARKRYTASRKPRLKLGHESVVSPSAGAAAQPPRPTQPSSISPSAPQPGHRRLSEPICVPLRGPARPATIFARLLRPVGISEHAHCSQQLIRLNVPGLAAEEAGGGGGRRQPVTTALSETN